MTSKDQKISVPAKYRTGKSSRERMEQLRGMAAYHPQPGFDPDVISWVTPNVAVTDWEGGVHKPENEIGRKEDRRERHDSMRQPAVREKQAFAKEGEGNHERHVEDDPLDHVVGGGGHIGVRPGFDTQAPSRVGDEAIPLLTFGRGCSAFQCFTGGGVEAFEACVVDPVTFDHTHSVCVQMMHVPQGLVGYVDNQALFA